jgi:hypothetical protein
MFGRAKIILTTVGLALATPIAAQVPGPVTTVFDGHYAGLSAHVSKSGSRHGQCPRMHTPDALTITNGTIQSAGRDSWTGNVDPQGGVVLRNKLAMRVNAHIDPQGTIRGEYHGPECIVVYAWRKQPV